MTSTQEPNTMAPQSALCIYWKNGKQNLSFQHILGLPSFVFGTSKFCFGIIPFSSLESELSFDSKDSEINFDRSRSTTVRCDLTA